MSSHKRLTALSIVLTFSTALAAWNSLVAGTLAGHVRDLNWYAVYQAHPAGVGYYEFAVNANATNIASLGGFGGTDIFGAFSMSGLPAGLYNVASWDVWWRSAFAFNVMVPPSGSTPDVDLRLKATMWGYPAFWDQTGYHEFGQTFVATGPISMIYLRAPLNTTYTLAVREGGPGGPRVPGSPDRIFSGAGDHRLTYGYGQMPTAARRTYYVRIRTSSPAIHGVIRQIDPRPDFSDPMPGGWLWLGDGTTMTPHPDRDLGLVIMSDDDGLLTNLYTRDNGNSFSGMTSIGQTFTARGVNLISAAFWLADPSAPTYLVRLREGGPAGAQVGTIKRGKPARVGADPEMIVVWSPGEAPLTPGQTYYLEVARDGAGTFNSVYVNTSNPFAYGEAYRNSVAQSGTDLAGTIMEEESIGSATRPTVRITGGLTNVVAATNALTVGWSTDVPSDSLVEYAAEYPPYTSSKYDPSLTNTHVITLTDLQPHTLYHYRVTSAQTNYYRAVVSRDLAICTKHAASNLLVNPGFEQGTGASPRSSFPGWVRSGGVDIKTSDGTWFHSLKSRSGGWLLQGAVNGSSSDGHIYQRISNAVPGQEYAFSAWLMTAARENNTTKYDVWNDPNRLIYMRLGIDPTGGTNAVAPTVRWTPRMYSHRYYTQVAKTAVAQSSRLTVFVSMKGDGVQWHLYAVDDCALTHEEIPVRFGTPAILSGGVFQTTLYGRANRTNSIETSIDLLNWTPLTKVLNPTGTLLFTNAIGTNLDQRFYRGQ